MKVVPLTDFVHNAIRAQEGHPIEIADGTALDLEKAGLVRIGIDKAVAVGKSEGDGAGQPSPSLPAAPASPITTSSLSKLGVKKSQKKRK